MKVPLMIVYFLLMCLLVYFITIVAKDILRRISKQEEESPNVDEETLCEQHKNKFRIVLEEKNVDVEYKPIIDSKLPSDANDIQNLNRKYNVNTYRGSDGRFKSFKK